MEDVCWRPAFGIRQCRIELLHGFDSKVSIMKSLRERGHTKGDIGVHATHYPCKLRNTLSQFGSLQFCHRRRKITGPLGGQLDWGDTVDLILHVQMNTAVVTAGNSSATMDERFTGNIHSVPFTEAKLLAQCGDDGVKELLRASNKVIVDVDTDHAIQLALRVIMKEESLRQAGAHTTKLFDCTSVSQIPE